MATKKTTKGRSKKRPDYAKFAFIVVLCFLSGAFSYGVLDLIFSQKHTARKNAKFIKNANKK